jgi:hypothetical protein
MINEWQPPLVPGQIRTIGDTDEQYRIDRIEGAYVYVTVMGEGTNLESVWYVTDCDNDPIISH